MDKEVIELCNAINSLPSLHTIESCCGHGKQPFTIWFKCDGKSMDGLFFLVRCTDRRYFQSGHNWTIRLEVGDRVIKNILPIIFILQSTSKGNKSYKQANALVENMNYHLNHKNFMKRFGLKIKDFNRNNNNLK